MAKIARPEYEDVVSDLYKFFKVLTRDPDPKGRNAQAASAIARALLVAMDRAAGETSKSRFANSTPEELYEFAQKALGTNLKVVS